MHDTYQKGARKPSVDRLDAQRLLFEAGAPIIGVFLLVVPPYPVHIHFGLVLGQREYILKI